ncbi:efflux RND transporter permease subunit [Ruminococcus sp. OA3]|uniref:efflux RND transporter permease subunit n=1 Tax=Ruminococcus sp. OA3 TaxID=2914164 RepID=UPI001F061D1A|nr:efflux RND transporter permease subunit [Ruminococcus sp. OA3]MCH1984294.1 efflux RND transporter permease subunit [Ruminococcus sp. OA3]
MLSKFSVKKPYTVVVGVVLILILGFVSFTKMTTDLLPNINLPYAIVLTTYPGASPSEVEETVTKPIEEAMATVSNIENMQSVSRENLSLVILQFAQSTSMDSVSLEMRENLDQIGSYWDDTVGSPIIMKLNPEMMPVMVAAVEKDGLDSVAISDLTNQQILSDLESLEGVASVSTSGTVEESIQVVIRQEKIDEVNDRVKNAVSGEFAEAQQKLDDARTELEESERKMSDAQAEIDSGRSQLEAGKEELLSQLPQAQSQLNSAQSELLKNETDLENGLTMVNTTLQVLEESLKEGGLFDQAQDRIDEAAAALAAEEMTGQLQAQKTALQEGIEQLQGGIASIDEQLEVLPDGDLKTAQREELETQLVQAQEALNAVDGQILLLESSAKELETQRQNLADARAKLESQKAELLDTKTLLESYQEQLNTGKLTLDGALAELNSQQISATIEMSSAQAQMILGEAQLEQGKTQITAGKEQLEDGQEELDEQKSKALKSADIAKTITADMVSQILAAQNFSMPAGYVTEDNAKYLVRVGDKFQDADEMRDLVLFDMGIADLEPVRLSDVADVIKVDNSSEVYASVNGQPGVLLTMQKQTGYATSEVSDRILDYFEGAQEADSGLHFTVLMDQGIYIDMVVASVLQNLMYGAILAIIVLYLFLRDVRPTSIVACSIPISVLTAVILMYFSGITLNIISLSGLALGVGMLVDNSIVVIENIYRLRSLGYTRKKAAVAGARQVAGAIMASTLTTICVFLPIVFTEGITRQLFVDMGLTIAYSLLASLFIALTLVPMMSAGMLKNVKEQRQPMFDRLLSAYGNVMKKVLRIKPAVLLGALALLGVSAWLCISRGLVYMPEMESTQVNINITMPEGATLDETGKMSDEIMERLSGLPDVESIGAMAGSDSGMALLGMGSGSDTETATMYLTLKEDMELSNDELAEEILSRTEDLNCEVEVSASSMDMSALGGSGISVEIKGKDLDKLQAVASDVAELVEKVPGTTEVSDGQEESAEEERIVVNKEKASEYNLTVAQVFQQISAKLAESKSATSIATDIKDYDVDVIDENTKTYTRSDVKKFSLTYTDKDGEEQEVAVTKVVDFVNAKGMTAISRDAQSRYISVSASIADGYNVTKVAAAVDKELKSYDAPEGYTIEMAGEDETIRESMTELMKMLLLAVAFIYLIMVAQFQSLLSPFIVMFTIPLAFTGGFLGLLLTGQDLSIIAMIGFIMLSGIIVNNGIVLVDYINQLRREGTEKKEAIIEAGKTRMRPIMMTALTTILGLATMAVGVGTGSDMMQGMAVVVIGGLLYGTLLTLFVVPCIYDALNRKKYWSEGEEELDEI